MCDVCVCVCVCVRMRLCAFVCVRVRARNCVVSGIERTHRRVNTQLLLRCRVHKLTGAVGSFLLATPRAHKSTLQALERAPHRVAQLSFPRWSTSTFSSERTKGIRAWLKKDVAEKLRG
jgi:hypothetical protein